MSSPDIERRRCARRRARGGFSLMEILVIFAILLILIALLLPALRTAQENARKGKCAATMAQYGQAFRLYQGDHNGMYPDPWVDNSNNWQSFLCGSLTFSPYIGPNAYLPTTWLTYNGAPGFAKRINGKFLCPTIVKNYDIPQEGMHDQWGYCLNITRVEISYGADGWPWFKPEYVNADLDNVYPNTSISAVMTCGNGGSWNSDNDWSAFTSINWTDWTAQPIHGDVVNVLFLDGHVETIDITLPDGVKDFNAFWYGGVPTTGVNPWFDVAVAI